MNIKLVTQSVTPTRKLYIHIQVLKTYWLELFIGVMPINLNCWGQKSSSETRQQGTDPLQTGLNHSFDKYGNLRHKSIAYTLFNIYSSFEEKQARHGRISSGRMHFWGNRTTCHWSIRFFDIFWFFDCLTFDFF